MVDIQLDNVIDFHRLLIKLIHALYSCGLFFSAAAAVTANSDFGSLVATQKDVKIFHRTPTEQTVSLKFIFSPFVTIRICETSKVVG